MDASDALSCILENADAFPSCFFKIETSEF